MNAGAKIQHPVTRGLAPNQEPHLQVPEKSSQKELEAMALGTASEVIEIVSGVGGAPRSLRVSPRPAGSPHPAGQAFRATLTGHPGGTPPCPGHRSQPRRPPHNDEKKSVLTNAVLQSSPAGFLCLRDYPFSTSSP